MVGLAEGLDDGLPDREVGFHPLPLFRNVGNKDVIDAAVGLGLRIVTVVVNPADGAVLPDDAVFHIVDVVLARRHLFFDGLLDHPVIVRVQHAPEGVPGQRLELLQVPAAEDVKGGAVGVQQLLGLRSPVDKETAGHVPADLLHNGNRLLVQLKMRAKHGLLSFMHKSTLLLNIT